MKYFFITILLIAVLNLAAIEKIVFPITQDQISSINKAMGLGYIGVADIWHQSPLMAWDNPAIPAMQE